MYLKTTYKKDPIFKDAKSMFTVYNNSFNHKFEDDLLEKVKMLDIEDSMLTNLKSADYEGFIKVGMEYADIVVKPQEENFTDNINALFSGMDKTRQISTESDENFLDSYYNLYNELAN